MLKKNFNKKNSHKEKKKLREWLKIKPEYLVIPYLIKLKDTPKTVKH